jgi:4-hydroxybenzoate polyprenyltransferase
VTQVQLMNKILKQSLDFILFSNIFIALCAVSQALVSYWLLGIEPNPYVLAILFCSTILTYNFSILLSKPQNPKNSPFLRVRWIFSHFRLVLSLSIISALSLLALAFVLSFSSLILMLTLGVISVAYGLPIWGTKGNKYGIRNIPGLKIFIIAVVWAGSTVLLPIFEIESPDINTISNQDTLILFLNRFLFILAITIPFDIRDLFQDNKYALKTIPILIGEKKSLYLAQAFLLIHIILVYVFIAKINFIFIALALSVSLSSWLILKTKFKKNEYFYFLFLDGTMIFQMISLYLFKIIS